MQGNPLTAVPIRQALKLNQCDVRDATAQAQVPGRFGRTEASAWGKNKDLTICQMVSQHHSVGALFVHRSGEKDHLGVLDRAIQFCGQMYRRPVTVHMIGANRSRPPQADT